MTRTPDQQKADALLQEAVDAVHRAYDDSYEETTNGVLVKYVIVSHRQWWDSDGDTCSAIYINSLEENVPLSDQLGLIEFASARIKHSIAFNDYEEDQE